MWLLDDSILSLEHMVWHLQKTPLQDGQNVNISIFFCDLLLKIQKLKDVPVRSGGGVLGLDGL